MSRLSRLWPSRLWPSRSWPLRLWPQTLAGQLIALLLIALIGSQLLTGLLFLDERRDALLGAQRDHVLARTATVVRLLEATAPADRPAMLAAAASRELRFALRPDARGGDMHGHEAEEGHGPSRADEMGRIERRLAGHLERLLEGTRAGPPLVELGRLDDPDRLGLVLSVPLADGTWLRAVTQGPAAGHALPVPALVALLLSAAGIVLVVAVTVRRVTRPLRRLADAAEAFGRGEAGSPLEVEGPLEARRTIAAFNEMRARVRRFLDDRVAMLAAISHDLRTPITALRLRAELVDDAETREKMLATLEELQRMVEATLHFARAEAAAEPTRRIDLAALVEALVEDFAETGRPVRYAGPESLAAELRPDALRRLLRNLIDNALTYGGAADVGLAATETGLEICVDDRGPGIPPEQRERVFDPFARLESSRSRETGGVGLGLSIARSLARSHGGDVTLHTAPGGGLRAKVTLPRG
jgi:signal transduction histidine kinase